MTQLSSNGGGHSEGFQVSVEYDAGKVRKGTFVYIWLVIVICRCWTNKNSKNVNCHNC
uniref:Uncharacterized protein n=1 Tax=Electrophorus electricus TaxID=8005 RepID=A0AAY5ERG4_ELEEL